MDSLGEKAFIECTSLEEVVISSTIDMVGMDAFKGCSSLKEISIPSSIKKNKNFLKFIGIESRVKVKKTKEIEKSKKWKWK